MKILLKSFILILSIGFFSTKIYSMNDTQIDLATNDPDISNYLSFWLEACDNNDINELFLQVISDYGVATNVSADLILKTLQFLLDRGATKNVLYENMLMHNYEIVELLINHGMDVNIKGSRGNTTLILAVAYNQPQIIKLLINAKANLDMQDDDGKTALMYAVITNHPEIAEMLIDAGADLDIQDNSGNTALMYATQQGMYSEVIEMIKNRKQKLYYQIITIITKAKFLELNH